MQSQTTNTYDCDVCDKSFEMANGRYNGKFIKTYYINVCMPCYRANWDGWAPQFEERVLKNLKDKEEGFPERNENDLLPRE